jgi:hypothetical protein
MPNAQQSTDAITLLKADHKEIRKTFADFEKAGDDAEKTQQRLVDKMIELLTVHTYIENEVMYPRVRALLPDLEDDILESYEEHHVADVLCMELGAMSPDDERFTPKRMVLMENVRHHIDGRRTSGSRRSASSWAVRNCRRSGSGCWRCVPPRRVARPSRAR